jgi:RHS repeat-associated protein
MCFYAVGFAERYGATEYNAHYFAHQNRLGGESYYTDAAGKLLSYNEFDAWGNAYTAVPEDINANGLNNGLGFTGYTWDGVLDLYFAQARMYDAASRRFVSANPVGGSVLDPHNTA